jgi:hypothetical protein
MKLDFTERTDPTPQKIRTERSGWKLGWGVDEFIADSQASAADSYDVTMQNLRALCNPSMLDLIEVPAGYLHNLLTLVTITSTHEMILMERMRQLNETYAEATARNLAILAEAGDSYGELLWEYGDAIQAGERITLYGFDETETSAA